MNSRPDEEAIFNAARRIDTPAARRLYVRQCCGEDTELQTRVEALLRVHDDERGFLHTPPDEVRALVEDLIRERPGAAVGPYRLAEQIGEGGFGLVFRAEQDHPVRREVALKILKPGMDTRQVIARFEAERQVLALMDHPNIARVLDAGTTDSGRPYFVMELVRGVLLTKYCDEFRLTPRRRLELFLAVCQAVQHAHQKGIIHRDLKPSNVLVTLCDGRPVPKVIDFGVAKATGPRLADGTQLTGLGTVVGTLEYMSPEQAELANQDIDTRSDIYSLGVLLYELLTGTTPLQRQRLNGAPLLDTLRLIREEEPPRPSTRLVEARDTLPAVAARRQTEAAKLTKLVRGELDWIVMKALEKDRDRRYETANSFAVDIEHHLADEPVQACPPSPWYRLRKLVRRQRAALTTAALVFLALVLGTAVSLWQAVRATEANGTARRALAGLTEEQKATRRELFDSLVAQARANRMSRRIGQRYRTLEIVRQAIGLARQLQLPPERYLELRNEAIAALALPDLRVTQELPSTADTLVHADATFTRFAQTDRQGNVRVRRVQDGKEIYRLVRLAPGQNWPHLSPNGGYLAVFESSRGRLHVWKLAGAQPPHVLNVATLGAVCFSPDSRQLAVQEANGAIAVFELATSAPVRRLPKLPRVQCIRFHPAGGQLAFSSYNLAQVRDLETGKSLWQKNLAGNGYRWIEWHPDGKTLAVDEGETISLWDVAQDKQVGKLEGVRAGGLNFNFNPAGTLLASHGWSGILSLWDPRTGIHLIHTLAFGGVDPHFSADGRLLAHLLHRNNVAIYALAAPSEYRTLTANPLHSKSRFLNVTLSADGRLLAAGARGALALWDVGTGKELAFLEESSFSFVAFKPRALGNGIAEPHEETLLTRQKSGLLSRPIPARPGAGALHLAAGQKLPIPSSNANFALSRDGRVLAAAQFQGALVLHADQPDQPIKLGPHDDVRNVAVSPDGRWVATARFSLPGGVKIWELQPPDKRSGKGLTYKPVKDLVGYWPTFSPDGKHLLIGGSVPGPLSIRRWEVGTWNENPFPKLIEGLQALYSPDGKLVMLETGSGVARLLDAATGKEYARLEDPNQHRTTEFAFTADGTKLACAAPDGYCVHIWDLRAIRRQLAEMGLDW